AIARCDWPAAWSRSTSLILRMDNRSAGISSSAGFIVPRKGMPAQGFRLSSAARSRGGRLPPESVAGITGMGGRLPPESVAGMDRNQWPASAGIGGRIRPEYAGDRSVRPGQLAESCRYHVRATIFLRQDRLHGRCGTCRVVATNFGRGGLRAEVAVVGNRVRL